MANDAQKPASSFEVLEDALQLLLDRGISRGAYARDRYGEVCGSLHPEADRFCVLGAINVCYPRTSADIPDLTPVLSLLAPYVDEGSIGAWNDSATDAEILAVLRAAINVEKTRILEALAS